MSIRDALTTAVADLRITTDEWNRLLKPHADFSAKEASPEARELLGAWANDAYELEAGAAEGLRHFLLSRGYSVPEQRPHGGCAQLQDQVLATNVSEQDAVFAALVERAGKCDAKVSVAVLDNSFDTAHPALDTKLWTNPREVAGDGQDNDGNGKVDDVHGWDFVDQDADPNGGATTGHGTHVTGIATAGSDQIDAIQLRTYSPITGEKVVQAIEYAAANGARVMNLSFKIDSAADKALILEAIARHPEILFVKSAGNDGQHLGAYDASSYLAKDQLPNLSVVASSDPDGKLSAFSNHGAPYATHAAQGGDVMSTLPNGTFDRLSGTSMAAPQVVNAAAKMLVLDPQLKPVDVQGMLADTSDRAEDWTRLTTSGGVINTAQAARLAALTGLVRSGLTAEAAADQLGLPQADRSRLLPLVPKYVAA